MSEVDPKAISLRIGQRIRHLRAARGLSIRQVADLTKMHRPLISRVELGTYMPRLDTIYRIAIALKVKVTDIVYVVDEDEQEPADLSKGET